MPLLRWRGEWCPRPWATQLKATGTPVLAFSDEELVTVFSVFDPTGKGKISNKQCNKALEAGPRNSHSSPSRFTSTEAVSSLKPLAVIAA